MGWREGKGRLRICGGSLWKANGWNPLLCYHWKAPSTWRGIGSRTLLGSTRFDLSGMEHNKRKEKKCKCKCWRVNTWHKSCEVLSMRMCMKDMTFPLPCTHLFAPQIHREIANGRAGYVLSIAIGLTSIFEKSWCRTERRSSTIAMEDHIFV